MKKEVETYVAVTGQTVVVRRHGKFATANVVNPFTGKVDRRTVRRYGFGDAVEAGQKHVTFLKGNTYLVSY
jgi:hypothetical protein